MVHLPPVMWRRVARGLIRRLHMRTAVKARIATAPKAIESANHTPAAQSLALLLGVIFR
jgi:hypothetical protein